MTATDTSVKSGSRGDASGSAPNGRAMMQLVERLYPICRSITGDGVRRTLDILGEELDLRVREVPTGTRVLDWEIPREWNIREAHVTGPAGERIVDFRDHNLHVLNYSVPVRRRVARDELVAHLHSLPDQPDVIPYRTSYYREAWGFCIQHRRLEALPRGDYDVVIDTSLEPGALTLAECVVPGRSEREILFSTHICHPSMCNDNLSGIAVQAALFEWLRREQRRYTYRAIFAPGTIGAVTWLSMNRRSLDRIAGGLVLSGLGDPGRLTYKCSRREGARIDRVVERALGDEVNQLPFSPLGYDERQYGSPGFDLPVGRLSRTPYGTYPQYHTSADDLLFISAAQLESALAACQRIVEALEGDTVWYATKPYGEPQLGRYGLYDELAGEIEGTPLREALLWVLNLADGDHGLLDIAARSGCAVAALEHVARRAVAAGLLETEVAGA